MALPATDDFNRTENPLGGNWTAPDGVAGSKFVANGAVLNGQGLSTFQLMHWNADSFGANHSSQATLGGTNLASAYGGVAVCIQASGQDAYVFGVVLGVYKISKMASGALTTLSTVTGTPTATDVLKLEISGSTLTAYVNGSTPAGGTASNSDFSGGAAGLWGYGGVGVFDLDDWTGDDVGGGSPPPATTGRLALLGAG